MELLDRRKFGKCSFGKSLVRPCQPPQEWAKAPSLFFAAKTKIHSHAVLFLLEAYQTKGSTRDRLSAHATFHPDEDINQGK
jgi:hypothetical protein